MKGYLTILALFVLIIAACSKSNQDQKAPEISFIGMQPNAVISGFREDTVFLAFRISDVNGDLGLPQTHAADSYDVYMIDSRSLIDTNANIIDTFKFYFPEIPKAAINPTKTLEGICTISIDAATYLHSRDDSLRTRDTLRLEVFVKDKALNVSNRFTTPDIYIERP
jgi:hypothetical protein